MTENGGGVLLSEKCDDEIMDEFMNVANKIATTKGRNGNFVWMFTLQKELDKRGLKPVLEPLDDSYYDEEE